MFDVDAGDDIMNPDKPSREEIEAKLTALLLGELPEEEARLLRWAIEHDAGLAKLYEQLKRTIGIVREVSVKPAESDSVESAALKLSDERREKLLAHFKTPRPKVKELFWLKRIEMPSLDSGACGCWPSSRCWRRCCCPRSPRQKERRNQLTSSAI